MSECLRLPTHQDLVSNYKLENSGPNSYYKCQICGYVEVGLREYLEKHLLSHEEIAWKKTA